MESTNNNISLSLEDFPGSNIHKSFVENDLEKGKAAPIGTVNKYGEVKTANGWVYQKKGKGSKPNTDDGYEARQRVIDRTFGGEGESKLHPMIGKTVKIPSNLTTDPANMKGKTGEVVSVNSHGDVKVDFGEGKVGTYSEGVVEEQKGESKLQMKETIKKRREAKERLGMASESKEDSDKKDYKRVPEEVVGNELYTAKKELSSLFDTLNAGEDYTSSIKTQLHSIIGKLQKVDRAAK